MSTNPDFPTILGVREQARVVNDLLKKRCAPGRPAVMP